MGFEIVLFLIGLGIIPFVLNTVFGTSVWTGITISAGLGIFLYGAQAFRRSPRHLADWQWKALTAGCEEVTETPIMLLVGWVPDDLEANDYAGELMEVFSETKLNAGYGFDLFPEATVVNKERVIVGFDREALMRIKGVQLWVADLKKKPPAALELARALDRAGISFQWKLDLRLEGTAAQGTSRVPIPPGFVLFVGKSPGWQLGNSGLTLYRYLQHFSLAS